MSSMSDPDGDGDPGTAERRPRVSRPRRFRCSLCGRSLPRSAVFHDSGMWACRDPERCRSGRAQLEVGEVPDDPLPGVDRSTTRCPNPRRLIGYRVVEGAGDHLHVVRVAEVYSACRSWACDHCHRGRRMEVRKHLGAGLRVPGRRFRFVTITFPDFIRITEDGMVYRDHLRVSEAEDVKEARRRVGVWVSEIRRILGRDFEYGIALEGTKRGRVHWHLITATPDWWPKLPKCRNRNGEGCVCPDHVSSRMPYRGPCVQKLAHRAGLGFVDLRVVNRPTQAITYLTKYLTKEHLDRRPLPRYCRRYSYSRRWAPGSTLGGIRSEYAAEVAERLGNEVVEARAEGGPGVEWWEWAPPPPMVRT